MEENLNLFQVFNQKVFRIPDYQRGYAWGDEELTAFWDDLDEIPCIDGELKKHYTGTLFLEEKPTPPEERWLASRYFDIVDGQQRLTTIIILIFELLKELKEQGEGYFGRAKESLLDIFIVQKKYGENNGVYKFRYYDTNQNHDFLLKNIFENNKVIIKSDSQNHYTENLKYAKEYFQKKITGLDSAQRDLLFRKTTSSLIFDIREIKKDFDVQAVFETMNNRGKPLTVMEKLKNRLIYLNDRHINSESDKKKLKENINKAWGIIYSELAKNPKAPLDEDEFLSAHLSLYEKPKEGYIFYKTTVEKKLFQMFCNKPEKYGEEQISYMKIENYIVDLSDLARFWYEVHNSNNIIRKIILVYGGGIEIKILLSALLKQNNDNREDLEPIFSLLESLIFRNNVPGMYAVDIESAKKAREIYRNNNLPEFKSFLEDNIKKEINTQYVVESFKYLFTPVTGRHGFHRWHALKYFLFAYEEYLQQTKFTNEFKETNEKISLDQFDIIQIEHVLPKNWSNFWGTEMNEYLEGFGAIDDDNKNHAEKVLINSLGNLTILGPKNQGVQDHSWSEKKHCFSAGSYNEMEISHYYDQWTYKSIQKRGEDMLKFLCDKVMDNFSFDEQTTREILFNRDYIIKRVYG